MAGGAYDALAFIDEQRQVLYSDMKGMALTRSTVASIGVVSSAWGVYNALRPGATASAVNLTQSDRERTGRLATVAFASYGLGQYFLNPEQESVAINGYNALTCLALQARPLLMASGTGEVRHGGHTAMAGYDALSHDLRHLEKHVKDLHTLVAIMKVGVHRAGEAGARTDPKHNHTARELKAADAALQRARDVLADGLALKDAIDKSGFAIRTRATVIMGLVNEYVQSKAKSFNTESLKLMLTDAQGISEAFKKIGAESVADDADDPAPAPAASDTAAHRPATSLLPQFAAIHSAALGWGSVLASHIAAAAAVTAASPAPAASAANRMPVKPKPALVTQAQLGAQLNQLKDFIANPEAQKKHLDELKRDAAIAKLEKDLAAEKTKAAAAAAAAQAKLEATIEQYVPNKNAQGKDVSNIVARTELARQTEALYAARRPVLQALINFRQTTAAVRSVSECNGNTGGLRIVPAEHRRVRAGDTLSFVVSHVGGQSALVLLQGNAGDLTGGKENLVIDPQSGLTRVTLRIAASAPAGTLRLVATDVKARYTESVRLTVQAASKPAAKEQPPKTPEVPAAK